MWTLRQFFADRLLTMLGICCTLLKAEKTTAESATAFLFLLYQIAMYVLFVLFSLCWGVWRFPFRPIP